MFEKIGEKRCLFCKIPMKIILDQGYKTMLACPNCKWFTEFLKDDVVISTAR